MLNIRVDHFYGVYPSSIHGNLALIDPLLLPVKCPLKCAICPISSELARETRFDNLRTIPIDNVLNSLKTYIETQKISLNGALIWGLGDPLCSSNILEFIMTLLISMKELGIERRIYIHSSLVPLVWTYVRSPLGQATLHDQVFIRSLFESINGILVPYTWYNTEFTTGIGLGWIQGLGLSEYVSAVRDILKEYIDKLYIELYLFRLHDTAYPDNQSLDELTVLLKYMHVKNIVLRRVDRPTFMRGIKPVSTSYVEKIREQLENEGFKVLVEYCKPTMSFRFKSLYNVIYNHILRIPLSHAEIRGLYGDSGIIAINNLIDNKLAYKSVWMGEIYYTGKLSK